MLGMLAIKDDPFHNLFEFYSSISLKLSCCVCCLHFVLDIQVFLVVVKKVAGHSFDQLFVKILQGEGFDDCALEEFCCLSNDISKVLLVDELLIILLLEKCYRPFALEVENADDVVIIKRSAKFFKEIVRLNVFL